MLTLLYIDNFRGLSDFWVRPKRNEYLLLTGNKGSGKSTIGAVLDIFHLIGTGESLIKHFISIDDFSYNRLGEPMRLVMEMCIYDTLYRYEIGIIVEDGAIGVVDEQLHVKGELVLLRDRGVYENRVGSSGGKKTNINSTQIALSCTSVEGYSHPLSIYKRVLLNMIVISPVPSLMDGSNWRYNYLRRDASNTDSIIMEMLRQSPSSYIDLMKYLKTLLPGVEGILIKGAGLIADLVVQMKSKEGTINVSFSKLSDGEKCVFLWALVLTTTEYRTPVFVFWDNLENFFCSDDISQVVSELQSHAKLFGQMLMVSNSKEVIANTPTANICTLYRLDSPDMELLVGSMRNAYSKHTPIIESTPTSGPYENPPPDWALR